MASFKASVALMNLQPVASDEASLDAGTLTPAVNTDTFTIEGRLLCSAGSPAGLADNQKVIGAPAPVEVNQDADSKQFTSDQDSNDDGAPAAGAPAGGPTDGANAPAPAPAGAPAGAGGLDGGLLPPGNPGGGPVEMSGNGGHDQGNGGGASGGGVSDDEDLNEVNFMARAHELFLLASPPVPWVCSVQEAARIAVEIINAHGGVGEGLGFGAAAAAPVTLSSMVAAAATGMMRASAAPAIGVSPEAPVEPTINLVFNDPAPGSTSVAASAAPAPSPSAGKPTKKGAQAAQQPILTAGASASSPSSFAPTGAVGPSKKTQTLAAENEAKRMVAERLVLELIQEEEAEKVKREKASKKHEKKKAAKAAKKAGAAGAHAEGVETTADSSSVGPSSSVAAAAPEPIAPIPERQQPAQEPVAKPAPPAEPERAVPKTVQVAKAVVQQHASAPAPIPAPTTVTPDPPAVPPKKESKKKAKEHAPTATPMATASGAGLSTSAGATTSAAVRPATPLVEAKVVPVPIQLAAAAAPGTAAAPLPAVATAAALVQAPIAAPVPAAADSAPHFNRTLALLNPALAAAAAARAGGLLPTAVRPVMSTAGSVTRTLPGVPIIRAAAPEASGGVPPPPSIPSYAGTAPAIVAAPIYRPAFPHPIQAAVPLQTAVPIPGTPAFTRPIPVVQAGPFMALSGVAPQPLVRTVQPGGPHFPVRVAAASAAPATGPRPTNPMAAAFMAYRSTTVTAAAAAAPAPAPVPLAAPRYEDDDEHLCVVCMEKNRSILLMPCGHLVLCESCLPAIVDKGNLCPICRESIQQTCHMGQ